jgi:hypothetical protein
MYAAKRMAARCCVQLVLGWQVAMPPVITLSTVPARSIRFACGVPKQIDIISEIGDSFDVLKL